MKIVTPEELAAHQHETIVGGAKGFAGGLAVALPASYVLNKRWAYYRALPLSLKSLGVIMVAVPSFAIAAERAGQAFERSQWKGVGKQELDLQAQREHERWQGLSTVEKTQDWMVRNQWSFIGAAWATTMAGAFAYIAREKTQTLSMKVVQARMWAQGVTIGVVLAAAAMSHANKSRQKAAGVTNTDHSWLDVIEQEERDKKAAEAAIQRPA